MAVTRVAAVHERNVTDGGAARATMEQFTAINTFLGTLKTAYAGTYHAFDFSKHADRYLAEVQYRFNRRFDLAAILARLLCASAVTRHPPLSDSSARLNSVAKQSSVLNSPAMADQVIERAIRTQGTRCPPRIGRVKLGRLHFTDLEGAFRRRIFIGECLLSVGSRPPNLIPTSSPLTATAALEPIRRGNRVPPIQWPLPRNHGKQT